MNLTHRAIRRAQRRKKTPIERARLQGATIGDDVKLPEGSVLGARCVVGDHTHFSGPARVDGIGSFTVGRWAAIGVEFRAITSNHDTRPANMHVPLQRLLAAPDNMLAGTVDIGHATWIGDRVTMIPGAAIGVGAVVGAASLVRSPVPPFTIAAGVPARAIRPRFKEDVVEALLDIAWWDWDLQRLERNSRIFNVDCSTLTGDDLRSLVVA